MERELTIEEEQVNEELVLMSDNPGDEVENWLLYCQEQRNEDQ